MNLRTLAAGKKRPSDLDRLAKALDIDWHEARCAGRVQRHVEILRGIAHEISPDPDRPDRPANAADAQARFQEHLKKLKAATPPVGLSAASARFVDHVVAVAERGGSHLFACFEDPRIPPNTNRLEGFFGDSKEFARQVTGDASTSNTAIRNLGGPFLVAFSRARSSPPLVPDELTINLDAYTKARAYIAQEEAPARRRRSLVRHPKRHIKELLDGYRAHLCLPSPQ
jgi:hypothetical protein